MGKVAASPVLRSVTRAGRTGSTRHACAFVFDLCAPRFEGSAHPLHLIYGVTNDFDLVEMDKLEAFAARIPNFTFAACVANPESSHPLKGYVTQHIEPGQLNDGDVDIYLCGPPPMVEAVSQDLRQRGIQPANFYYEKFAASA